ncbi:MAG TPA: universal stress protein [Noviherbaspirillum sp.]|nr:universal stress protein [Noviherbaspirillum sp.]
MFNKILVPTDGSPLSEKAVSTAVEWARSNGAALVVLSVAEPHYAPQLAEGSTVVDANAYNRKMLEIAQANVAAAAAAAREAGVPCETLVRTSMNPHEEIVNASKERACDVIVMASHGRKGLRALFVGSETHKVLAYSTVPVLVVR